MSELNISVITLSSDDEDEVKYHHHEVPPVKKFKVSININEDVDELVILSDDENVTSTNKNNTVQHREEPNSDSPEPSEISKNNKDTFNVFLDLCTAKIENPKHKELILEKIGTIRLLYKRASDYVNTEEFAKSLTHRIKLLDEQPKYALHCFNVIFQELKQVTVSQNNEADPTRLKLRKKVEKKLYLLHVKIRKLENAELTLEELEDEDSAYIQLQRYKERAKQLYDKYCELFNEDAYTDRITHRKLRFNNSKYDCINKAIRRRYKNNYEFPSFYNIDKLVRKCVARNNLELSAMELEREIKQCFEALGNLLQKRRKQDLLDIHADFITSEDPAEKDESLQNRLKVNKKQGEENLNKLCTEFVIKQENGEDNEEVPDPGDSDDVEGCGSENQNGINK